MGVGGRRGRDGYVTFYPRVSLSRRGSLFIYMVVKSRTNGGLLAVLPILLMDFQPQHSLPHHVVFIADPQLVDPHTYPGRPWPLSSLTIFFADLYLFRASSLLQQKLRPDTTFFLGDLFDGGREWATATTSSPEERYKGYGNDVWMKE